MKQEARERAAAAAKATDVELQWRFSDYRNVDGISFPHHLTKTSAGQVDQEWQITKFTINPALKPEGFEKKERNRGRAENRISRGMFVVACETQTILHPWVSAPLRELNH